jgi:hypothetical protein
VLIAARILLSRPGVALVLLFFSTSPGNGGDESGVCFRSARTFSAAIVVRVLILCHIVHLFGSSLICSCSGWAYSSLVSPSRFSLPRFHFRVGLHIVLFEIP